MTDCVPVEVTNIIKKVAKVINLDKYEIKLNQGNKKGEGFLGEIVFLELVNKLNGQTHDIVIKRAFRDPNVRQTTPIRITFLNEICFYKNVLPALQNFQKEHDLEPFNKIPNCLLTSTEEFNEYLVLENLKQAGFEIFSKRKILDYKHMKFIFKTYGQLHAASFLFRIFCPEEFQKVVASIHNVQEIFFKVEVFRKLVGDICISASEKLIPGEDDEIIKAFEKYKRDGINLYSAKLNYEGNYPLICHGDCWSNNLMFKYDKDRKLEDMRLLDWQITRTGSAVQDLSYCLYSSASKETFERLDDLLNIYYTSFASVLKTAGKNAEELYPFSVLKEEWIEYCPYGFVMAFIIIKIKTTNDEEIVDLTDLGSSDNKEEIINKIVEGSVSEEYDLRIRDLVTHLYKIKAL